VYSSYKEQVYNGTTNTSKAQSKSHNGHRGELVTCVAMDKVGSIGQVIIIEG